MGVKGWRETTHAVIGAASIQNTSLQVADPRLAPRGARQNGGYGVNGWHQAAHSVLATSQVHVSWVSLADPRLGSQPRAGAYGVKSWNKPTGTIIGAACHDNSAVSVADARGWPQPTHELRHIDGQLCLLGPQLDLEDKTPTTLVIKALDGTWHRPLTTLELAALQSLPTQHEGQWLALEGRAHKAWRQRIGNAIPPATAYAIAQTMRRTLDASDDGMLLLCGQERWVQPHA